MLHTLLQKKALRKQRKHRLLRAWVRIRKNLAPVGAFLSGVAALVRVILMFFNEKE